ncbi:hypothetical protein M422DRAFT_30197 [Sphaerobolus stellatus SS14]|uniref:Uncharacterized protein n=1 Tax=Sphaerobolus stellatus (strain SS14) TaxID=990650 RepID=A0A0C9VI93_SPHS4|nr:hypothetical protein M422DRAFT_31814 [Sphaerobolus stellatus SS14]KIJ44709.1 hypothetical protein M422DRAFT_30197 [Sphaerobolus stellatus SS14]
MYAYPYGWILEVSISVHRHTRPHPNPTLLHRSNTAFRVRLSAAFSKLEKKIYFACYTASILIILEFRIRIRGPMGFKFGFGISDSEVGAHLSEIHSPWLLQPALHPQREV